eukprot:659583_1
MCDAQLDSKPDYVKICNSIIFMEFPTWRIDSKPTIQTIKTESNLKLLTINRIYQQNVNDHPQRQMHQSTAMDRRGFGVVILRNAICRLLQPTKFKRTEGK